MTTLELQDFPNKGIFTKFEIYRFGIQGSQGSIPGLLLELAGSKEIRPIYVLRKNDPNVNPQIDGSSMQFLGLAQAYYSLSSRMENSPKRKFEVENEMKALLIPQMTIRLDYNLRIRTYTNNGLAQSTVVDFFDVLVVGYDLFTDFESITFTYKKTKAFYFELESVTSP
jgi:hypothetical protein